MSDCVFCDIVAGTAEAQTRLTFSDAIVITPLRPVTEGHVLVIPRKHVRDAQSEPEIAGRTMYRACQYWDCLHPGDPVNFITSCGEEATQSVFHLHIHIVPRRKDDGLHLPWTGQEQAEPETPTPEENP